MPRQANADLWPACGWAWREMGEWWVMAIHLKISQTLNAFNDGFHSM